MTGYLPGDENVPELEELLLMVSDVQRSKEFYVERLKFKVVYEGNDFVILHGDHGPSILLHDSGGEPSKAGTFEMEFRVADVDRLYAELVRQGVAFRKEPFRVSHEGDESSPRREARLNDPDDYGITLYTPLKAGRVGSARAEPGPRAPH